MLSLRQLTAGILFSCVTAMSLQAAEEKTEKCPTPAPTVQTPDQATIQETIQEAAPPVKPKPDYSGPWWTWPKMTGDWGGARTAMEEKGITIDLNVTQVMQDNMHGGASTKNGFRYSGSADLTIKLDTCKMGLWEGGTFIINAEPKWGKGINGKVGSLIPVNMDAIKPNDEKCEMALSEWFYQQVLFEGKLILLAGKLDGARAFDTNVFANDERTQFMNVALRNNPIIPTFLPYTPLGLGVVVKPLDWLTVSTAVTDAEGEAGRTGFDTTFHGPTHTTLIHEWAFHVKPFGLPGNQRVGFMWSSQEYKHMQPTSPFKETGPLLTKLIGSKNMAKISPLLPYETSADGVALYYNFDQYLYQEQCDPTQGIGLFGRFGWARQDMCAVAHFYSLGVGSKGLLPDRDKDTAGVGYFFCDLSNDLPAFMHSEQGIETYYNVELTPWLHLTPDLQVVINPGGSDAQDVSVVAGLRVQVDL